MIESPPGRAAEAPAPPVEARLRRLLQVLAWAALLLVATYAAQSLTEVRRYRLITEQHEPGRALAERLVHTVDGLQAPAGLGALDLARAGGERFVVQAAAGFRNALSLAAELHSRCERLDVVEFGGACSRLERARKELLALDASSSGDLVRLSQAVATQPLSLGIVARQFTRLHEHAIAEIDAALQRQNRWFWIGFAILVAVTTLLVGRESRRQLRLIGEQVRRERQLKDSLDGERLFIDAVLATAPALVMVLDGQGRIQRFNRACEALSGRKVAEVAGRPPWDDLLAVEDRGRFRFEGFAPLIGAAAPDETTLRARWLGADGAARLIEWRNARLSGRGGETAFVVCAGLDVTQREAVLKALQRSEEAYERAESVTHIGTWDWDLIGDTVHWTDEIYRIYGHRPGAFKATYEAFLANVHPDDRAAVNAANEAALADPSVGYDVRYRVVRPDRSLRVVRERGAVYRDSAGRPQRMVGTVHDITELHETQERLRTALREREVLLKEIYHRVKNNLQMVSSLLMLQSRSQRQAEARATLLDSAQRIKAMGLVHEQLYSSGDLAGVSFADYCAQLIDHLRETFGRTAPVRLEARVEPLRLDIQTAVCLGLIINELVSNAFKHAFAAGDGLIEVVLQRVGAHEFELSVCDDGCGLPADFEPHGTGTLGMQLVTSLAGQLAGTLEWGPASPRGTRFRLRFAPEIPESQRMLPSESTG